MTTTGWYRLSAGAGLVLLVLAVFSALFGNLHPCGGLPASYQPLIAFELARSSQDLAALFGSDGGACRDTLVKALDQANYGDFALFMPCYALFLIAFFRAERARAPRLATAAIFVAVIAVVGDLAENLCLLGISGHLEAPTPWLRWLPFATGIKWLALGVNALGAAWLLGARPGLGKLGAATGVVACLGTVGAVVRPALFGPVVALGVGVAWLAMLTTALANTRRT